ncbi:MAG: long-chain fatty acid--CoA ligase, partial [Myxococcales bacterium]|nr:long-chain fatty acid--CoA ligase [Myxococcales bacterium]
MASDTIPARLFEQARRQPSAPAYHVRGPGGWQATSYKDYADEVRQAAKALINLGFEAGQNVCILGFNRPEWVIFDVAAMAAGGAPAGIYTTCSPPEVQYIVHHAEAPIVLVENASQWEKIKAERERLPHLRHVVTMKGAASIDDPMVMTWEQFMAAGEGVSDEIVNERLAALEPRGLATLIYTSGTTGPPKGVMLCHENLTWTTDCAAQLVQPTPSDCSLSYLPLSHIAEQMFTIHVPISAGMSVYFAESIERLPDNLKEVQPTVFFGVPRIWEKFHAGISGKLALATGVKKLLVTWAMGVGEAVNRGRMAGRGEPGGLLGLQYALAGKLIFSKLKPAVGLGRARVCVSGAAPISREVLEFFAKLDIVVLEVYGQSEDTGPTSFNRPERFRFGTVGPALPGVEVKIAADEEIVVRGPNVFLGYYKEPQATAETLIDGWLHSGDLGAFDEDGFLKITGRKKEIIVTAGGKNVAPKNIEAALKNHPLINEAVVIGDRRKYLTVLVTLDPDAGAAFAKEKGIAAGDLPEHADLRAEVQRAVDEANKELARVEQIKKFTVLPRNLTIEDGELTPTLKVKRKKVHEKWSHAIEAMYA